MNVVMRTGFQIRSMLKGQIQMASQSSRQLFWSNSNRFQKSICILALGTFLGSVFLHIVTIVTGLLIGSGSIVLLGRPAPDYLFWLRLCEGLTKLVKYTVPTALASLIVLISTYFSVGRKPTVN